MNELNASIRDIPVPDRMKHLAVLPTGYLQGWFMAVGSDGVPIPQAADAEKRLRAYRQNLCWCCGQKTGVYKAFVIGPMCMVNRITSEPASHLECAEYAVKVCPYLRNPNMKRNPHLIEGKVPAPGVMIERNPGVSLIWVTRHAWAFKDHNGQTLFQLGDPENLKFYAEGRGASRAEVMESIRTGLPRLREMALIEGKDAVAQLDRQCVAALRLLPAP